MFKVTVTLELKSCIRSITEKTLAQNVKVIVRLQSSEYKLHFHHCISQLVYAHTLAKHTLFSKMQSLVYLHLNTYIILFISFDKHMFMSYIFRRA